MVYPNRTRFLLSVNKTENLYLMKQSVSLFVLAVICALFSACQKAVLDEDDGGGNKKDGVALRFQVTQFEQMSFDVNNATRATDVGKVCTRLNFAVYQNGTRVEQINQLATDADFGSVNLSLATGKYLLVVMAHSCGGNATMTDPSKVTFPNNKLTDTFWYGDSIEVREDSTYSLKLQRVVAMFRLQTTDTVTTNVKMVRFYYTGGSSTFDAVNGVGCVNSKQTENFTITNDMVGTVSNFEAYTFPKADSNVLNIKLSTHDQASSVIWEETLSNVPIQRNVITVYKGRVFSRSDKNAGGFNVDLNSDDEWTTNEYVF